MNRVGAGAFMPDEDGAKKGYNAVLSQSLAIPAALLETLCRLALHHHIGRGG